MSFEARTGLLLMNLGTPEQPETSAVRRYLRQFLSDARVLDIPTWKRQLILNLFILPTRPKESAEAYRKVWTERGSPLLFHSLDLAEKVRALVPGMHVEVAMRYGHPSTAEALDKMRQQGVDRIVAFPLYPQYASSATGSALEELYRAAGERWNAPYLQVVPPFYDHPAFVSTAAGVARPVLDDLHPERVIFSYHGLPERHVRKSDEAGDHCLVKEGCCDRIVAANRNCYRAHCFATTRALAERLEIPESQRVTCFQSRLGRDPWLKPYTDEVVVALARDGVKRAAILSPAFVADCLETIEELGMRAAEDFMKAGGEELRLVPSLNASDAWARAVVEIAGQSSAWVPAPVTA